MIFRLPRIENRYSYRSVQRRQVVSEFRLQLRVTKFRKQIACRLTTRARNDILPLFNAVASDPLDRKNPDAGIGSLIGPHREDDGTRREAALKESRITRRYVLDGPRAVFQRGGGVIH